MYAAVTVPSLMLTTSIVFEESLARNRQTDRQTEGRTDGRTHTHRLGVVYLKRYQGRKTLKTKTDALFRTGRKTTNEKIKLISLHRQAGLINQSGRARQKSEQVNDFLLGTRLVHTNGRPQTARNSWPQAPSG